MEKKKTLSAERRRKAILSVVLAVICIIYVLPVLAVAINSFKLNTFVKTDTFALHARLIKSEGVPGGSHAVKGRRAWRTSRMTFCDEQTRTAYEQQEQICAKNLRFYGHSH